MRRRSPAYNAVTELKERADFSRKYSLNKPLTNQAGESFYLLRLSEEVRTWALTLGRVVYRTNPDRGRVPHISVYEHFKLSERFGKSVFHLTWYGVSETRAADANKDNVEERRDVVVHVYFSQTGAYLYSNVTARVNEGGAAAASALSQASVDIELMPQEEALLRRYAIQFANPVLTEILQFVHQQADAANSRVDDSLVTLESIRAPQSEKYLRAAENCIRNLENFDRWRFGRTDARLNWLRAVVSSPSGSQQSPSLDIVGRTTLFASGGGQDDDAAEASAAVAAVVGAHPKILYRKRKAATKSKTATSQDAFNKGIDPIDAQLHALESNAKLDDTEKALQKLCLLEERVVVIAGLGFEGPEEKVLTILREVREHHDAIQELFREKVKLGDLFAVERLTPFVPEIKATFFADLVMRGSISMIEYIIDHFPESIIYVNYFAFNLTGEEAGVNMPLLMELLDAVDRFNIFELLLQKGADPNVCSVGQENRGMSVLDRAVFMGLSDHVRVLLSHGAYFVEDFQALAQVNSKELSARESEAAVVALTRGNRSSRRRGQSARKKHATPVIDVKRIDGLPDLFRYAVSSGSVEIVRLFVEYGKLPLSYRTKENFDLLGVACCSRDTEPNEEMVRVLVEAGADVNAPQADGLVLLEFQIQEGRLSAARLLLDLGADPNVNEPEGIIINEVAFPINALLSAVLRKKKDFVRLILENKKVPVSVVTYVRACGFYFSPDHYPLQITVPTLEISAESLAIDKLGALLLQHCETFDAEPFALSNAVREALAKAEQFFEKGNYRVALRFYTVGFLFGEFEIRHQACTDIARCFKMLGDVETSELFQQATWHHEEIDDPMAAGGASRCGLM